MLFVYAYPFVPTCEIGTFDIVNISLPRNDCSASAREKVSVNRSRNVTKLIPFKSDISSTQRFLHQSQEYMTFARTLLRHIIPIPARRQGIPSIPSLARSFTMADSSASAQTPSEQTQALNKTAHDFSKVDFDSLLSRRFFFTPSFEIYGGESESCGRCRGYFSCLIALTVADH